MAAKARLSFGTAGSAGTTCWSLANAVRILLRCGLTAFVLSVKSWHAPWPPSGFSDPILRNPLFWLTRLAVIAAIMLCIIFVGVLTRTALAFGLAQLRQAMAREGR
jgi:hypothetical protein